MEESSGRAATARSGEPFAVNTDVETRAGVPPVRPAATAPVIITAAAMPRTIKARWVLGPGGLRGRSSADPSCPPVSWLRSSFVAPLPLGEEGGGAPSATPFPEYVLETPLVGSTREEV